MNKRKKEQVLTFLVFNHTGILKPALLISLNAYYLEGI